MIIIDVHFDFYLFFWTFSVNRFSTTLEKVIIYLYLFIDFLTPP